MHLFCRATFLRTKGIVPDSDKDALYRITLELTHWYMFDTKYKVGRWGIVLIPEALIDEYAARMLAKVVVRRGPQAEEAQHVHLTHVPIPRPHHENFT